MLDASGNVLWESGGTDSNGVIVDTSGRQLATEDLGAPLPGYVSNYELRVPARFSTRFGGGPGAVYRSLSWSGPPDGRQTSCLSIVPNQSRHPGDEDRAQQPAGDDL